jgi:hypothetical protein
MGERCFCEEDWDTFERLRAFAELRPYSPGNHDGLAGNAPANQTVEGVIVNVQIPEPPASRQYYDSRIPICIRSSHSNFRYDGSQNLSPALS